MLSLSGHKLHAPKGIGMLYIRKGVVIPNLIDGGGQERRHRGGTQNIPYIVGLAKALEVAKEKLDDLPRVAKMRDRLIEALEKIPYAKLNGHRTNRLPGNVNIGFEFIEGESLLLWLDIFRAFVPLPALLARPPHLRLRTCFLLWAYPTKKHTGPFVSRFLTIIRTKKSIILSKQFPRLLSACAI